MNLSIYCFEFSRPSSWSSLLPEQRLAPWDLHDLKCPRFSHTPWTKSPLRVQKRSLPENHLCVSWRENSIKQKLPISPSIKIFPRNAENFIFIKSFQFFYFFSCFLIFLISRLFEAFLHVSNCAPNGMLPPVDPFIDTNTVKYSESFAGMEGTIKCFLSFW